MCKQQRSIARRRDTGYAWLIVFLAFCTHTLVWGFMWTIGIWTTQFENVYGQSKAYTSLLGSGTNAVNYIGGLVGSIVCKRLGNRMVITSGSLLATLGFALSFWAPCLEFLFVTFSVLIGFGLGSTFIPAVEIINEYFDVKKTIAFGLSLSGVGCGMLVYPSINNIFISYLGWQYALLANAGLTLIICLCGLLMKPFESTEKVTESFDAVCQDDESICINEAVSNEKESLAKQFLNSLKLFQNVSFCLFCVNNLLFFAAMTILWVHLNGYIIKNNFGDSAEAGLVYSVIGISNVFGRIFLGLFCDHDKVNPIVVYAFGNFLLALNELYASFAQSFGAVIVTNVIYGFISSVGGPLLPSIIIEFLGEDNLAAGFGFLLIFEGIGSFLGPPLAGLLFNLTKTYDCAFYLSASLFFMGGSVMSLPILKYHKSSQSPSYNKSMSSIETQTFVDQDED